MINKKKVIIILKNKQKLLGHQETIEVLKVIL